MEKGNYLIWSYMRCFDHDKPDFGIDEYLQKAGCIPEGFCALVAHPDFVHLHDGMEKERILPPQLCGCRKDPRRLSPEDTAKMTWTNFQFRGLAEEIHRRGMKLYISLWGNYFRDLFHPEWLGQHKELLMQTTTRVEELHPLKRLKDGSYYEDFLIAQLVRTMQDYGLDGVHLSDRFSPQSEPLADGDYSADMVDQFCTYAKITLPADLQAGMGEDSTEQKIARQRYIWKHHRAEWLRFHDWRWTRFYEKVCAALHSIGCKVSTLGMYVSDTLRSMYSMGIDIGHLAQAGVDFFTPNILPTSCTLNSGRADHFGKNLFHRYMTFLPAIKAKTQDTPLYLMLGVRDEEEEWDVMRHEPVKLERDIFTAMSYQWVRPEGLTRCIDAPFVTIGDSIGAVEWENLHRSFAPIFGQNYRRVVSPVLVWSETAGQAMLEAHIATRRPSVEQIQADLQAKGAFCGGVVKAEDLACHTGSFFAPAFDLLAENERAALLQSGCPVLAMAPAEYDTSALPVTAAFTDPCSAYPQQVFLLNTPAPEDLTPYEALLAQKDDTPDLPPEEELQDEKLNVMFEMYSQKISDGFREVCAALFCHMDGQNNPISSDSPLMVLEEADGSYRVLVYGRHEERYDRTLVKANSAVASVETLSAFPYRPVQFVDQVTTPGETRVMAERLDAASGTTFQLKLAPNGVSVFRIKL